MNKLKVFICSVAILLIALGGVCHANMEFEAKAFESAQIWLNLVDESKYEETWASTSTFFREAVSKNEWVDSIKGAEQVFGKVKSRGGEF